MVIYVKICSWILNNYSTQMARRNVFYEKKWLKRKKAVETAVLLKLRGNNWNNYKFSLSVIDTEFFKVESLSVFQNIGNQMT